jgi:HD superfamily phosphohydrolase
MSAKIFRDPLYNYISIDRDRDGWLLDLLDCAEVQRLRRIHHLGISYLTYPGADHSRLSHSLGVVHLMQEALSHLAATRPEIRTDEVRQPLLAAALVHDVGHGPFSHLFEQFLEATHESWSCKIIRSPETAVHGILGQVEPRLPEMVAALIEPEHVAAPAWQRNLLSSQLDVDRLDYLRRDSLFTGAGYGHFDWFRILHTFSLEQCADGQYDLVWTEKAKFAIEEYIFARFYMYQNVYRHRTTRGFERMLQAAWAHAQRLHHDGVAIRLAKPVAALWQSSTPSIRQYLALEEFVVLAQVQEWTEHADRPLSDLCRRFLNRNRFVPIEAPESGDANGAREWQQALEALAEREGFRPASLYVLRDDRETTSYSTYVPTKRRNDDRPFNAIRIQQEGANQAVEISELLPRLQAVIAESAPRVRCYVPRELRQQALKLQRSWVR